MRPLVPLALLVSACCLPPATPSEGPPSEGSR